jgi:predicted RNase H-like nuclease
MLVHQDIEFKVTKVTPLSSLFLCIKILREREKISQNSVTFITENNTNTRVAGAVATYIGIDGYRRGWVAAYIDEAGGRYLDHRLLAVPHTRAMIDLPVGLPDRGYRQCDVEARALVGSRVFLGARWGLWKFKRYEHANRYYWRKGDTGISMQLWCIRHKLRDVNTAMTPGRQVKLRETHPELVFWRLAGRPLDSKKSVSGRTQRIKLLRSHGIRDIDRWLGTRKGTGIGRDDLLDACACALAARDSKNRFPRKIEPEFDSRGIRIEIWY